MALGTLCFRARSRGAEAEELPAGLRIRGEVEWVAQGAESDIDALLEAVGAPFAERVSRDAVLLRFGNSVGRFDLGSLGTLTVQCGKWGEETFDALLLELTEIALALPYAADQGAGHPHDRTLVANNAILLHAFLYARQLLLTGDRQLSLASAMAAVTGDPYRRLVTERRDTELTRVQQVDARTVERLVAGAARLERARGVVAELALAKQLRGHLPTHVDTPRIFNSLDTAENRFVLAFLEQLSEVTASAETLASEKRASSPFWARVKADCVQMHKELRPMRRHPMWEPVARLTHIPVASSVLQRRRGYREVFGHHLRLRAASRLPLDEQTSQLLGLKDIASLYELWCYFALVRAVGRVLGRGPDGAQCLRTSEVQQDLPRGARVAWGTEIVVYYNLTFSRTQQDLRRSASLQLRPDIAVCVREGRRERVHVFDAKLRIDRGSSSDQRLSASSFKWTDIAKMHAYRDALPAVRTAFVLYPGDEFEEFVVEGDERGAVGAVPLVPGRGDETLVAHLRRVVLAGHARG